MDSKSDRHRANNLGAVALHLEACLCTSLHYNRFTALSSLKVSTVGTERFLLSRNIVGTKSTLFGSREGLSDTKWTLQSWLWSFGAHPPPLEMACSHRLYIHGKNKKKIWCLNLSYTDWHSSRHSNWQAFLEIYTVTGKFNQIHTCLCAMLLPTVKVRMRERLRYYWKYLYVYRVLSLPLYSILYYIILLY